MKNLTIFFICLLALIVLATVLHFRRYINVKAQDWLFGPQLGVRLEDI